MPDVLPGARLHLCPGPTPHSTSCLTTSGGAPLGEGARRRAFGHVETVRARGGDTSPVFSGNRRKSILGRSHALWLAPALCRPLACMQAACIGTGRGAPAEACARRWLHAAPGAPRIFFTRIWQNYLGGTLSLSPIVPEGGGRPPPFGPGFPGGRGVYAAPRPGPGPEGSRCQLLYVF